MKTHGIGPGVTQRAVAATADRQPHWARSRGAALRVEWVNDVGKALTAPDGKMAITVSKSNRELTAVSTCGNE